MIVELSKGRDTPVDALHFEPSTSLVLTCPPRSFPPYTSTRDDSASGGFSLEA